MPASPEVTIASWNAQLAFDPRRPQNHEPAFGAIEALDADGPPVDVLCIPELTGDEADDRHLDMIRGGMRALGYHDGSVTTGVRDDGLSMSLWTRLDCRMGWVPVDGDQRQPRVIIPGFGDVVGVHNMSDNEPSRIKVSRAIVRHATAQTGEPINTIAAGDFNAPHAADRSVRLLRLADRIVRHASHLPIDYYHGKRWEAKAGVIIRGCAMTRGEAMAVLTDEGFVDADPSYQPTVFYGSHSLCVDHIVATPDFDLKGSQVFPQVMGADGSPITDHAAVKATALKTC